MLGTLVNNGPDRPKTESDGPDYLSLKWNIELKNCGLDVETRLSLNLRTKRQIATVTQT
jgi:hypothetical protein